LKGGLVSVGGGRDFDHRSQRLRGSAFSTACTGRDEIRNRTCGLEGDTYSLLETKRLIEFGEEAAGKDASEAPMILNHKVSDRIRSRIRRRGPDHCPRDLQCSRPFLRESPRRSRGFGPGDSHRVLVRFCTKSGLFLHQHTQKCPTDTPHRSMFHPLQLLDETGAAYAQFAGRSRLVVFVIFKCGF
jgi:hypothetical protein